eukprot:5966803-Pleurochrysis_carterae.AAC.1
MQAHEGHRSQGGKHAPTGCVPCSALTCFKRAGVSAIASRVLRAPFSHASQKRKYVRIKMREGLAN